MSLQSAERDFGQRAAGFARPDPLPPETVLANRFRIEAVSKQDDFAIAYLATDTARREPSVLREVAPAGSVRVAGGMLDMSPLGEAHASRLRHTYLLQERRLAKLRCRTIPSVRFAFCENGTAYSACESLRGARSLDERLRADGPINRELAESVLLAALDALESAHAAGMLHLEICPASVLVGEGARVWLVDFGGAKAWHYEASGRMRQHTPYDAPELSDPLRKRTPAADFYALAATVYESLTGEPIPLTEDVVSRLPRIDKLRTDLSAGFGRAIEECLRSSPAGRPQSAAEVRSLLARESREADGEVGLETFDERAVRLMGFRFGKRECPACGGILESVRPLRKGVCPVCREGFVRRRSLEPNQCPVCRVGALRRRANDAPIAACPICETGILAKHRKRVFSREYSLRCRECEAEFEPNERGLALLRAPNPRAGVEVGIEKTHEEWRALSGRASVFWHCDSCAAQIDALSDGRLALVSPANALRHGPLYREEWARIAADLPPYAGNSECEACGADLDVCDGRLTIIEAHHDPYGFAREYAVRSLSMEDLRWLAVGKLSRQLGLVCLSCATEFDDEHGVLRLVQTSSPNPELRDGKAMLLEDWHRAARGLPLIAEEPTFEADFDRALIEAYESGGVSFGSKNGAPVYWRGPAIRHLRIDGAWRYAGGGRLVATSSEVRYRRLLRTMRLPIGSIESAGSDGELLILTLANDGEAYAFEVPESNLSAKLRSGTRTVSLGAGNLARRIEQLLSGGPGSQPDSR